MSESLLINNQWQSAQGQAFTSFNPANNEVVWQGAEATPEEVNRAITAARGALSGWAQQPLAEREALLNRYVNCLKQEESKLAELISQETGKPLWESKTEVGAMLGKIGVSIQAYKERTGCKESEQAAGRFATRHKPHGVLAVFGPYNFPGHLPNGHIVPAVLAGNTVVFKPSELTPAVGSVMMECWVRAGLPDGVINLVQGGRNTGAALADARDIDGILFTGSYNTGKWLHQQCGGATGKLLALEMGGNNPLLVFEVEDINAAVFHTISSAFITSGQRCTCARRLIVPAGSRGDEFIQQLVQKSAEISVAPPQLRPEPFMGSLISKESAANLLKAEKQLLAQGAESLLAMEWRVPETGIVSPGIVDVTAVSERRDEEFFGPLLQVIRVKDFTEAMFEANHTKYGLAAGLLSDDAGLYERFYQEARAGIVNWNKATTGASSAAPFGGIGHSGNHRPSAYYAADYCAYPVASVEADSCELPQALSPGLPEF